MRAFLRILPQLVVLAVVLGLIAAAAPGFLDVTLSNGRLYGSLIDILNRGAPVALLAVGMTLVIATGGIDLSVGAVMAIAGAVAAHFITSDVSLAVTLGASLGIGLLCGLWNGALVAILGIQPIIATLILMVAGRGIAQLITDGFILTFNDAGLIFMGSGSVLAMPVPVLLWLGVGVAALVLVRTTALGMLVEAIGTNRRASYLAGVGTTALVLAVYAASGLCAAVAGVIAAADIRGADANNAGLWLELDAILAVVIGGTSLLGGRFSLTGSLIGALIIQSVNTGILLAGFRPEFNLVIKAAIIVVILVLQSPASSGALGGLRRRAPLGTPVRGHAAARARKGDAMTSRAFPLYVTLVIFALAYALCVAQFPNMLSTRVAGNLLTDNAFLGIAAVGMTFVILSGGIDLSIGSVIAFTGIFLAVGMGSWGIPPLAAIALLLLIATLFGAAMGAMIHYLQMPAFIVTLAGMFLARGVAFLISTDSVPIDAPLYDTLQGLYYRMPGGGRFTFIGVLMLAVFAVGALLAHRTRFGRNVYAVGGNRQSAELMGVPVAHTTVAVYALSSFLAGLSGVVFSLYTSAGYSLAAVGVELDAIAAVVIGGTLLTGGSGFVAGTLLGVLIMGLIQTYIVFDGTLSSWWTKIVIGLLLFAFILLQRGLVALPARRLARARA